MKAGELRKKLGEIADSTEIGVMLTDFNGTTTLNGFNVTMGVDIPGKQLFVLIPSTTPICLLSDILQGKRDG